MLLKNDVVVYDTHTLNVTVEIMLCVKRIYLL